MTPPFAIIETEKTAGKKQLFPQQNNCRLHLKVLTFRE